MKDIKLTRTDTILLLKASLIFYAVSYFLSKSSLEISGGLEYIRSITLTIAMVLCVVYICLNVNGKSNLKNIVCFLTVVFLAIAIWISSGYSIYIMYLLYIIAARSVNTDALLKFMSRLLGAVIVIMVTLCFMNIIPDYEKGAGRHGLGLNNYTMGFYFFHESCLILYVHRNKLKSGIFLPLFFIGLWFFLMTKTLLCFVCVILLLGMYYSVQKKWLLLKGTYIQWIFVVLFCLQLFLTYNHNKVAILDMFFSMRMTLQARVLDRVGISFFPRLIEYYSRELSNGNGTYWFYVDSGYVDLIIRFGIIITSILLYFLTMNIRSGQKRGDKYLSCWLICVAAFNFVNNSFFDFFLDCSLVFLWDHRRKGERINA